jgi:hydroxymethylglutaryl-CoA lyase
VRSHEPAADHHQRGGAARRAAEPGRDLTLAQRQRFIEALLARACATSRSAVSCRRGRTADGRHGELFRALTPPADAELTGLVPNMKGYELARDAGVGTVAVVVSATETMNQKNIRMSLDDTLAVARAVIERGPG